MAIDAQINRWSRFDRKNYFYADLPQGYQISQLYHPLVGEGTVEISAPAVHGTRGLLRVASGSVGVVPVWPYPRTVDTL